MATQNKHAKERHILVNGVSDLLEDQSLIKGGGLRKWEWCLASNPSLPMTEQLSEVKDRCSIQR